MTTGQKQEVRALTLFSAWSWAIMYAGKRIENRSWEQRGMIGSYIVIHAGKNIGSRPGDPAMFEEFESVALMAKRAGSARAEVNRKARIVAVQHGDDVTGKVIVGAEASKIAEARGWFIDDDRITVTPIHTSAFVGVAKLIDIVRPHPSGWYAGNDEGFIQDGGMSDGTPCFAYVFDNVIRFKEPIPYARGDRKLWRIPDAVLNRIRAATRDGVRL